MRPITDNKSLIEWLETKDPNESYKYLSSDNCLLANYFKEKGFSGVNVSSDVWAAVGAGAHELPEGWNYVARGERYYWESRHTYGQALSRARELLTTA